MKTWNKPEINELEVAMTMEGKKTPGKVESVEGEGFYAAS